jgi:hypothetical protein
MTICDRCKAKTTNAAPVGSVIIGVACERLIGVNQFISRCDLCQDCLSKLGVGMDSLVEKFCEEKP